MNLYTCTVPRKSSGWNVNSMIGWIQPALFQCSLHVPVLLCAGYMGPHWILGLAWHYMCTYANAQWGTCIAFRCILQKHDMIYDIIYSHPLQYAHVCNISLYFWTHNSWKDCCMMLYDYMILWEQQAMQWHRGISSEPAYRLPPLLTQVDTQKTRKTKEEQGGQTASHPDWVFEWPGKDML